MNQIAKQRTVADIVEEYEEKKARLAEELEAFNQSFVDLKLASSIQGKFVRPIMNHEPRIYESALFASLLSSAWQVIYDRLQIDRIASAKDRKHFQKTMENPPELTFETAKATFGDYLMRPRFHILKGLAEAFADLDPAYRSHSKVKIGVAGLPKRVVLTYVQSYGSHGRGKLRDILQALAAYRGEPMFEEAELSAVDRSKYIGEYRADTIALDGTHGSRKGPDGEIVPYPNRGVTVKTFKNGNAHIFFDRDALLDINRALAEFYGEVLPDAEEDEPKKQTGTAVAKDLQFYPTPQAVIEYALDAAGIYKDTGYRDQSRPMPSVLEPSCGDGRIMDEVKRRGYPVFGFEVHAGRAAETRAKGHHVMTTNFLDFPPREEYDIVVMNPPFYGRHYVKHVNHAMKFLRPGGKLVSILPATAHYDHGELTGYWQDLPVGSFSESGTNVPTGILVKTKPAK